MAVRGAHELSKVQIQPQSQCLQAHREVVAWKEGVASDHDSFVISAVIAAPATDVHPLASTPRV